MKFTLLIPTLNEIEGMKAIMPQIDPKWVDQILVVDGGSTDGTVEYAKECGYEVYMQKNPGLRNAYIESYDLWKGDVILAFSPDGNSEAKCIPPLIEKMKEGYEMIIVSRYFQDAKSYDDDMITAFGNKMFTGIINLFYGCNYTDAMVMYRGFKKEVFKDLDLHKEESYQTEESLFFTKVCIMPLFSIRAAKRKINWIEIPGDEPKRIGGIRKLQIIRWGSAYLYEVIREKFVWK